MTVSRNKLTKKDITQLAVLSIFEQCPFCYERMQAGGYTATLAPTLKKIYGDNKEELGNALGRNMTFFNTEPHMATFQQGLHAALEEAGEDRDVIMGIRDALFGPFAGLGDAVFWFTLLPVTATICCSLCSQGNVLGPILFLIIWAFLGVVPRIWLCHLGYNLGTSAVDVIRENAPAIAKAAGILGVLVVGALIPSYVGIAFNEELVLTGGVAVQAIFDSVIPNLLPLALVLFFYWLIKKKNIGSIQLIIAILIICIAASYFNIFAY
ncbi:MAG: PTS system mannose/fructose/sorbose family transporter subunit IID [Erysipelotrichaceae bacterium]|nr:PTS system mannose/fructose/sorbose family transporter subunit IID [Erysipelotrichaceae bacterium]